MEAWFISDIHLKSAEERNGQVLLRFLHSLLQKDPQQLRLYLLGDIFDLWIGGHEVFVRKYYDIIQALIRLKEAGAHITFIEGNHDVHIEGYFKKILGIDVFVEAQIIQLDGFRVRMEHGDLINLNDLAYLRYRSFVRRPEVKFLAQYLPGRFWNYIGERASAESRKHSSKYREEKEKELVSYIRTHAERVFAENASDVLISGHMHVFDEYLIERQGRRFVSYNLGSWLGDEIRALAYKDQQWQWVDLK